MYLPLLLAWLGTAQAQDPSAAPVASVDVVGTIDHAIEIRQAGDPPGARTLLLGIEASVPPELRAWWLYQRGICEELDAKPLAARLLYEDAIRAFESRSATPGAPGTAADARFRLALVLEELGDGDGALAQMQILGRARGLDASDEATVALQRAMTEIAAGRTRKGLRDLDAALLPFAADDAARAAGTATTPPENAWLRAKARYTLVHVLLGDGVTFNGRGKHDAKVLEAWAEGVKAAQEQIVALTHLQDADLDATWLMRSLLELGDSYAAIAVSLSTATVPPNLDAAEALVYRRKLADRAKNARANAWHLYDEAIAAAERLHFESPLVAELKARREASAP